eukprot:CAMPEP_0202915476 /NCGR_PEP_ID=MMETSP1392-20130828/65755_1 /ASSEMBLY_ACC=CAM_ASM_000868 /TAXON_ID=225041 /ORGANISM="Chlamydomonas chlamydogama, Strain SAG 11-48b" /LENGTH=166 /DNA_ID=CAMNT_0049607507 /DNA_START=201 /DNA_END=704 /DNA_ORIENTATION=-
MGATSRGADSCVETGGGKCSWPPMPPDDLRFGAKPPLADWSGCAVEAAATSVASVLPGVVDDDCMLESETAVQVALSGHTECAGVQPRGCIGPAGLVPLVGYYIMQVRAVAMRMSSWHFYCARLLWVWMQQKLLQLRLLPWPLAICQAAVRCATMLPQEVVLGHQL